MVGACDAILSSIQVENCIHSIYFLNMTSTAPSIHLYIILEIPACACSLSTSPFVAQEISWLPRKSPTFGAGVNGGTLLFFYISQRSLAPELIYQTVIHV
jgi:hypothetical protein